MNRWDGAIRRQATGWSRTTLEQHQLARLNALLTSILPHNSFYAQRLPAIALPLEDFSQFGQWPCTQKHELIDGASPFAANRTFAQERYTRLHRTSGTHGNPLAVLDTAEDWQWWIDTWQYVLDAAEVKPGERALMAFSFGPFIGFWSAFDALAARHALTVPAGGMSTRARLELLAQINCQIMCSTPSYALHLAEVAQQMGMDASTLGVNRIIVAGEPGGSIPATRQRIETAWQARVIDHSGATEVGPWGYGTADGQGLHVIESEFIAEFLALDDGRPAQPGELAELVLTSLGRVGCPVIRYRTGDVVRPTWPTAGDRFVRLEGGVLGRVDDMLVIRGVNVFPTALEQILRSIPEVVEFRITAHKQGAMDALSILVEDHLAQPDRIADELQRRIGLKVHVECVPIGSLPRPEGKGQRFQDQRSSGNRYQGTPYRETP